METKERKTLVAVDESKESMHALSWCISNLISENNNNNNIHNNLVLLYVRPPSAVYSLDAAGNLIN